MVRNTQTVPNPDIFQYIEDGETYLKLKFPVNIQPAPLFPIFITSLAKVITPFTIHHEVAAVHWLNITLASLSLVCIYTIGSYFLSPLIAFLLTSLVATNQLFILYTLGATPEAVYCFFLTFSLVLYHRHKGPYIYLLFGLMFLIRYEAIVIPISVFIIQYFEKKHQLKLKNVLISFTPIVFWLVILHLHSSGKSLVDNTYIVEIFQNIKKVPNLLNFTSLIEILTTEPAYVDNFKQLVTATFLGLLFYGATKKSSKPIVKISYLIFGFHLLFLYCFPNFDVRHYVPIIWIGYLILINQKSRLITFTFVICLLAYNLGRIDSPSSFSQPNDRKEYWLLADWLNHTKFDAPVRVLIYEPWILSYYVNNPQVYILPNNELPFQQCDKDIFCLASAVSQNNPLVNIRYNTEVLTTQFVGHYKDTVVTKQAIPKTKVKVYVVTTENSSKSFYYQNDQYTPVVNFINTFDNKIIDDDDATFKFIHKEIEGRNWANVFEYVPR